MTSTWSRGEPILSFDPELNHTLRRMNEPHNHDNIGNRINRKLPLPVYAHNKVIVENPEEGALRRQPPAPRPQEYYRGNVSIVDSDGPFVPPLLQKGHSFMVTSILMQMLTARGLIFGATI